MQYKHIKYAYISNLVDKYGDTNLVSTENITPIVFFILSENLFKVSQFHKSNRYKRLDTEENFLKMS